MQLEDEASAAAIRRLRRAEGQIAGVVRMLEEGRDCKDVVTQLAAASKAIERTGFQIIAGGLRQCMAESDDKSTADLERVFMSLA